MQVIMSVVFSVLLFSGCISQPKSNNSIVKIIDQCGSNSIIVTDIKGRKKADGFMQAQIIGESTSNEYQRLEYRIVWFNKEGFVIESILSKWREIPAYANQPFHINNVSPNTKAKTFRIYLRLEKEVICDKQSNGY